VFIALCTLLELLLLVYLLLVEAVLSIILTMCVCIYMYNMLFRIECIDMNSITL